MRRCVRLVEAFLLTGMQNDSIVHLRQGVQKLRYAHSDVNKQGNPVDVLS